MLKKIFSKKKKVDTSGGDIKLEAISPDYIPYACHYTPETLLTKNGELIQIVKVTGIYNERVGCKNSEFRALLKKSITNNINNSNFAVWFHTIRRKHSLDPGGDYDPGFTMSLNKAWKNKNNCENKHINEVYISIVRSGLSKKIAHPRDFLQSLLFPLLRKEHEDYLSASHEELSIVVDGILDDLKAFEAQRLTIIEEKDGFYSQQLQFIGKLINFDEVPISTPINDISEELAASRVAFGFNTVQVRGRTSRQFGSIFVLKEVQEIPGGELDRFLQLPQEFIITETIDFINGKKELKEFKKQHYVLELSGSHDFSEAIGLDGAINIEENTGLTYGEGLAFICLINNNLQKLEENIISATDTLKALGVVTTRMDLRMEEVFYAQLPGNFYYLPVRKLLPAFRAGSYSALYNFPAGNRSGNLWGPAVTLFLSSAGMPYFFNFHNGDCGHTTIIGPFGSGKTALMNFLVSESRKFHGKLFFFDQLRASKVFIKALGGNYYPISPLEKNKGYSFNPFNLDDTPRNRTFLKEWIAYVADACGIKATPQEVEHLEKLVDYSYSLPKEKRCFSNLAGKFGGGGPVSLEKKMSQWYGQGIYAHIFDNGGDDITSFKESIYAFGMSGVLQDQAALGPILSYLLYRVEMALDGTPTIIVIDEAWNLINNRIFAPMISAWLDKMKANNAIVIFASENINDAGRSELTRQIASKIATQIFMPNSKAEDASVYYREGWGVSPEEFKILANMNKDKRQFMIRHKDISIVASLELSGMKELDVLSGTEKTAKIMEEVVAMVGESPDDWLPAFYEKIQAMKGSSDQERVRLFVV